MSNSKIYSIEVKQIDGKFTTLDPYRGKVLLIVNVASKCGLTPQYEGLETLYNKYQNNGLVVLGFPCNQFGGQEPADEKEIQSFCEMNYKITFPLFAKIEVNGKNTHPLYQFLKHEKKGILGTEQIKWNFTKFLIGRDGQVIKRFSPHEKPVKLSSRIEAALKVASSGTSKD